MKFKVLDFIKKDHAEIDMPIIKIQGDDEHLIELIREYFYNFVSQDKKDFNYFVLNDENTIDDLINAANTHSFFDDKKIVYVKNMNKTPNVDDLKKLSNYVNNPNQNTIIVVEDGYGIFKDIIGFDKAIIDASPIASGELQQYVKLKIAENGYTTDDVALSSLISKSNNNLSRILIELEKLYSYCLEDKKISIDDVQECVGEDIEYGVFQLSNALANRNNEAAFKILSNMIYQGIPEDNIFATVSSQYRRMFSALVSSGSDEQVASALGIKVYAVSITRKVAKKYTPITLKKIFDKLNEIEMAYKSGKMTVASALQLAICYIMSC